MSVWDLKRNDIKGCVDLYDKQGVSPDEARVMIRLQDDPAELLKIMKTWKRKMAR